MSIKSVVSSVAVTSSNVANLVSNAMDHEIQIPKTNKSVKVKTVAKVTGVVAGSAVVVAASSKVLVVGGTVLAGGCFWSLLRGIKDGIKEGIAEGNATK